MRHFWTRLSITLAALFTATSLFATKITVTINAVGSYDFAGKHFYIIPANDEISAKDAEFKDYAQCVSSFLQSSGGIEVSDPALAEVCILMDYLITDHTYVERVPVPVKKDVGTTIALAAATLASDVLDHTTNGNRYSTGSYTTNVLRQELANSTGYTYKMEDKEVDGFRRVLNIYAYDNVDNDGDPDMLWKCNYVSDGSRNSLNTIVPAMTYCTLTKAGQKFSTTYTIDESAEWGGYKAYMEAMSKYAKSYFSFQPVDPDTRVNYIIRDRGVVKLIMRQAGPSKRNVTDKTQLVAGDVVIPISSVEHVRMGSNNRVKKDETLFYTLVFMGVPDDVKEFDVVCPDKFTWRNIQTEN